MSIMFFSAAMPAWLAPSIVTGARTAAVRAGLGRAKKFTTIKTT